MKRLPVFSLLLVLVISSCIHSQTPEKVKLQFKVIIPANAPGAPCIAGSFNDWNPAKDTLVKISGNLYSYELETSKDSKLEYKYTCGAWNTVENDRDTLDIANRKLLADASKTVYDTVYSWKSDLRDSSALYIPMKDGPIEFVRAKADVDYFFNTVQQVHPNLLANVTVGGYLKLREHVIDTLRYLSESGNLMRHNLALEIGKAAAFFKDGHTSSWSYGDMLDARDSLDKRLPPFKLKRLGGKYYISGALPEYKELTGCELTKINGEDVTPFILPKLNFMSGERAGFILSRFIGSQQAAWFITGALKNKFTVTAINKNGEENNYGIEPVNYHEFEKIEEEKETKEANVSFDFYGGGKVCYFRYGSFWYSNEEKGKIDSMFALIKKNNTQALIMDLRYNGGGHSGMGDYILDYLTEKPFIQFSKIEMKISQPVMRRIFPNTYKKLAGLIETHREDPELPHDRGFKFKGKFILLTSETTFSSAADFAATVQDFKIGTILGEETGGNRASFGDVQNFYTPNYRVQFSCSYKLFYPPVPRPDDLYRGTIPDMPVTKEILDKYKGEKDPVFSYALDYAEGKK